MTLYTTHGVDLDRLEASVESIAVTEDGRRALIGSWTELCELVNLESGTRMNPHLGSLDGSPNWQGGRPTVAMTPDGRLGLIGTQSVRNDNLGRTGSKEAGLLWLRDLSTGKELFPFRQPYNGDITSVAISTDGLRGLSASDRGELTLWDLTIGQPIRSLGPQKGGISPQALAFFPNAQRAASGGRDRLVHIWDLGTGSELAAWSGHRDSITSLAISADGRRIVTGGDDGGGDPLGRRQGHGHPCFCHARG